VDDEKRAEMDRCGRCGQPEDAHKYRAGEDDESIRVLFALGGPCLSFAAPDAAVVYQRYLAITDHREPQWQSGKVGKRWPVHPPCGHRHRPGHCPLPDRPADPQETTQRGAARARQMLEHRPGVNRPESEAQ
jgi:hypothetical protein